MEEKIKQTNPTLHRYLFTVTTFSKLLAMFLFILLPFVGFYLGMRYQEQSNINPVIYPVTVNQVKVSPTAILELSPTSAQESLNSYMEIKELGVKLNIAILPELKYKYVKNSTGDDVAILYSEQLLKYCSPDAADAHLGVIFRINGKYSDAPPPKPGELLKQKATYFLSYRSPQQPCTYNAEGLKLRNEQEDKVRAILSASSY